MAIAREPGAVKPRIGLDSRLTRQMSVGMKQYVTQLVRRLPEVAPEFDYVAFGAGANFGWDEQVRLPLAIARSGVRLVHFASPYVPVVAGAASVITLHDLIHLRFPQYFSAKVGPYYRTVVRAACVRARRVITDDERTVDDLTRYLGVDPTKVRVIPLGVDDAFFDALPASAGRPYVLYVGNHRRHKDLPTLLAAWSALDGDAPDLCLTGDDDFGGELQRAARGRRRAIALGDLPVEKLAEYYAGAVALVQPALREGFGLPMLEAMAAGSPVVASREAVPGVLAPAVLDFPAGDALALRERLESIARDEGLRAQVVNLGKQIARRLTWDRCARATADVYREVLEEAC